VAFDLQSTGQDVKSIGIIVSSIKAKRPILLYSVFVRDSLSNHFKKLSIILGVCLVLLAATIYRTQQISADEVDDLQKQINELENLKQLSAAATAPLEKELTGLDQKITSARNGIAAAKKQAEALAVSVKKREADLAVQYTVFTNRIGAAYRRSRTYSPLALFLASHDAAQLTKDLAYQSSLQAQDNTLIRSISSEIQKLQQDKVKLEQDQVRLAALQKQLDAQAEFFRAEIAKAKTYQANLSGKIAALSAQQQAIISARSGTSITSVGEVPLADDFNASIGYKAQAPGNSFAVFSFGGYTHRNGMSQYGAKARAEAGQSVEEILKAYYPNATIKQGYDEMGSISVQGYGSMSFEDQYLQGIYEMPGSWHMNALKAQAIAARTFAIKYTGNGGKAICTTEACQVFKNSKKGGDWEKAVNETKGWVLVDGGGSPVSTQYASTHGGYASTSGWDTTDKSNSGDWSTRAWESKAGSPWFYKAWYRSGYLSSGANCGRNHPWLSQEEFSDIVNAWIVRQNPNGADTNRIQPVTIGSCNVGGGGGNPYSMSELRDWANKAGGAVTNVSSVVVSHGSNGQTSEVKLNTNRGTITISGSEFKTTFNLRAPGYLRIPQSGFAFFNIEHKN
jgi:peptidoglycan hydrolase-like amidase